MTARKASATERLARWDGARPWLSPGLCAAMDELAAYQAEPEPRLTVLASQPSLLAEWREAAASVFPAGWTRRERTAGDGLGGAAGGFDDLCCDATVVLATALHIDPAGLEPWLLRLRPLDKEVFLVLTRFHQVSPGGDVVRRKSAEAARRFDLPRLRVLPCSPAPAAGTLPLAGAAREIRTAIEAGFPEARKRQADALAGELLVRARAEARDRREALCARRSEVREEAAIARSTAESLRALASTVGESFHRWRCGFVEQVASLTWEEIRPAVEAAVTAGGGAGWTAELRRILLDQVRRRWQSFEATHSFDLGERLNALLADAGRALEKNLAALERIPGLPAAELAAVRRAATDTGAFAALRERSRSLAADWQPVALAEVQGVIEDECRGLELAIAERFGRRPGQEAEEGPPQLQERGEGAGEGFAHPSGPGREILSQGWRETAAGVLRDRTAEAAVGSALGRMTELLSRRLEQQRRLLVEQDLPRALERYLGAWLDAYARLEQALDEQIRPLSALLKESSA